MDLEFNERVEEMLPHADAAGLRKAAAELAAWIADQAAIVRGMGPTVRTAAHLSATRDGPDTSFECSFLNRRGDLYTVTVTAGRRHRIAAGSASTIDATAAMIVMGALLEELGMTASLQ